MQLPLPVLAALPEAGLRPSDLEPFSIYAEATVDPSSLRDAAARPALRSLLPLGKVELRLGPGWWAALATVGPAEVSITANGLYCVEAWSRSGLEVRGYVLRCSEELYDALGSAYLALRDSARSWAELELALGEARPGRRGWAAAVARLEREEARALAAAFLAEAEARALAALASLA